jgi:hypothetical protein
MKSRSRQETIDKTGSGPIGRSSSAKCPESRGDPTASLRYEIHIERGCVHGQDVDDWLQAEGELEAKYPAG